MCPNRRSTSLSIIIPHPPLLNLPIDALHSIGAGGFFAPQPSAVVIEEVLLMLSELRRSPRSCCHSSTRSLWPSCASIARPGGRHEQTARHSNTDGLLCTDSDRRLLDGPLWLLSSLRYVVTGHRCREGPPCCMWPVRFNAIRRWQRGTSSIGGQQNSACPRVGLLIICWHVALWWWLTMSGSQRSAR